MSNHYHVVVCLNPNRASDWSDDDVVKNWLSLFPNAPAYPKAETVATWRARLTNLSWYMRCLNEPLARWANREDGCTGRFWEGRFHSQALLDEQALLKCMAYVDLNPVRAGIVDTPASAAHTAAKARIHGLDTHLAAFSTDRRDTVIPYRQADYMQLLDWTSRLIHADKRAVKSAYPPPIITRIGANPPAWITEMRNYGRWYYRAVGSTSSLRQLADRMSQRWLQGVGLYHERLAFSGGG